MQKVKNEELSSLLLKQRDVLRNMENECDDLLLFQTNSSINRLTDRIKNEFSAALTSQSIESSKAKRFSQQPESENDLNSTKSTLETKIRKFLYGREVSVLFGGQGYNTLDEMKNIYTNSKHKSLWILIFRSIDRIIKLELAASSDHFQNQPRIDQLLEGIQLVSWIKEKTRPDEEFLFSASLSYPLTLVAQMSRYFELILTSNIDHEEWAKMISSGTGHSQGIMAAAIISASKDTLALFCNFTRFLRLSLYIGIRCETALERVAGGMKQPGCTPMLNVRGIPRLDVLDLMKQISTSESDIFLGLSNFHEAFVLSGVPNKLEAFRQLVDDLKKTEGKYKTASIFFLRVGAAFHSPINDTSLSSLSTDAKRIWGDDFNAFKLHSKVICTTTGENLSLVCQQVNLLEKIITLQTTDVLDFERTVTALNTKSTQVIVDFGPGDGTAKLARNILMREKLSNFSFLCTSGKLRCGEYSDKTMVGVDCLE